MGNSQERPILRESKEYAIYLRNEAQILREFHHAPLLSAISAQQSAAVFSALYWAGGSIDKTLLADAAESHASAALGFDRTYRNTHDAKYLRQAIEEGERGVTAAEGSGLESALSVQYHTLGKMYVQEAHIEGQDNKARLTAMQRAVDLFSMSMMYTQALPSNHQYRLYIAEMGAHRATASLELDYLLHVDTIQDETDTGDLIAVFQKESNMQILNGELKDKSYERAVWHSGLLMRYAVIIAEFNPTRKEEARKLLEDARRVVAVYDVAHPDKKATLRLSDIDVAQNKLDNP